MTTTTATSELLHEINIKDFNLSPEYLALATKIFNSAVIPDGFEVRPYQDRVGMQTILKTLQGHRNILLSSATGSGKTFMMAQAAQRFSHNWENLCETLNLKSTRKVPIIGFTCIRPALVTQAAKFFKEAYPDIFPQMRFFSYFSNVPEKNSIDILLEDEAQHSASDTASGIFDVLSPSIHIGCTATAYRTDKLKLAFSTTVKDAGIRQLIEEGYLSSFYQYLIKDSWTPQRVANLYLDEAEKWGKSVIFFLTQKACYECAELIRKKGKTCEVVIGGNTRVQDRQIKDFRSGKVDLLINAMVLTEGFDAPELQTVFIRPGSKGPTTQMAGRALRKFPGQTHVNIVQTHDTQWNFAKTAKPLKIFDYDEKQGWTSQVDKINELQALAISNIIKLGQIKQPPEPEYIRKRRKKQKHFTSDIEA